MRRKLHGLNMVSPEWKEGLWLFGLAEERQKGMSAAEFDSLDEDISTFSGMTWTASFIAEQYLPCPTWGVLKQ